MDVPQRQRVDAGARKGRSSPRLREGHIDDSPDELPLLKNRDACKHQLKGDSPLSEIRGRIIEANIAQSIEPGWGPTISGCPLGPHFDLQVTPGNERR